MDEVTVTKEELLKKLRENRKTHVETYKDAVEGFQKIATDKLQKTVEKIKKGELIGTVRLNVPVSHEDKYDEAIAMIEMSVDDEITLRRHEFNNYVLDKWVSQEEKNMLRNLALSSSNAGLYA